MSNAGAPTVQETSTITNEKEFGIVKRITRRTASRKMDVNMEKLEGKKHYKNEKETRRQEKIITIYTVCSKV